MYEGGLLYTLYNIGYRMLNFFIWFFDWLNQPIPLLNNASVITVAFSSAITIGLLKSVIDFLAGDILPGD